MRRLRMKASSLTFTVHNMWYFSFTGPHIVRNFSLEKLTYALDLKIPLFLKLIRRKRKGCFDCKQDTHGPAFLGLGRAFYFKVGFLAVRSGVTQEIKQFLVGLVTPSCLSNICWYLGKSVDLDSAVYAFSFDATRCMLVVFRDESKP